MIKSAIELVKSPFWYLLKPRKVGWSEYGSRGLREGGGNCLKYLKRGWNRKEGRGNKYFKKEDNLGQGVGALKRMGAEPPYKLCKFNLRLDKRSGQTLERYVHELVDFSSKEWKSLLNISFLICQNFFVYQLVINFSCFQNVFKYWWNTSLKLEIVNINSQNYFVTPIAWNNGTVLNWFNYDVIESVWFNLHSFLLLFPFVSNYSRRPVVLFYLAIHVRVIKFTESVRQTSSNISKNKLVGILFMFPLCAMDILEK